MSRKLTATIVTLAALLLVASVHAQEGQEMPEMTPEQMAEMQAYMAAGTPGEPHATLAKGVGTYDLNVKMWHEPGGPVMEDGGTATRTMGLDGRVMIEEMSSSMMGMSYTGHGMTGFDNVTGKYWSIWTDSMSTGLMVSEGNCDEKNVCTFVGSWNDPIKKKPVTSRMVLRWTSPNEQLFEMYGPSKDGKEYKMMELTYTKK